MRAEQIVGPEPPPASFSQSGSGSIMARVSGRWPGQLRRSMASILDRALSLVRPGMDAQKFYAGKTVTRVEWWISWVCHYPELYWGRLRVYSDGTADAAFDESDVFRFDDQKYAGYFLGEDEYTPLENLDAQDEQNIGANVSELIPPTWSDTSARFHYLGTY